MDALRGRTDSNGKGAAITGSIRGDFLYSELLLAVSIRTDWWLVHYGKSWIRTLETVFLKVIGSKYRLI